MRPGFLSGSKSRERSSKIQNAQDDSQRGTPQTERKDSQRKAGTPKAESKDSQRTAGTPNTEDSRQTQNCQRTAGTPRAERKEILFPTGPVPESHITATISSLLDSLPKADGKPPSRVPPHQSRFRKSAGLQPFGMHGGSPFLVPGFLSFLDTALEAQLDHDFSLPLDEIPNQPGVFPHIQKSMGVSRMLRIAKEKLSPGWHNEVAKVKAVATELQALVAKMLRGDMSVKDNALRTLLQLEDSVEVTTHERCPFKPTKVYLLGEKGPPKWLQWMANFHVCNMLIDMGLLDTLKGLAHCIITTSPSLANPWADHVPRPPFFSVTGIPDPARSVLKLALALLDHGHTHLDGCIGIDGKRMDMTRANLDVYRAEPNFIILAMEKWANEGPLFKELPPEGNVVREYCLPIIYTTLDEQLHDQLLELLKPPYGPSAFGKCLRSKSLKAMEIALPLLRRVVAGTRVVAELDMTPVSCRDAKGGRPELQPLLLLSLMGYAWLANLLACMETLGNLAVKMDRSHEDAGELLMMQGMINDISDVITNNFDAMDSPRRKSQQRMLSRPLLPEEFMVGHAAMNWKMTTLQPLFDNSSIILSMRPYADVGGLGLLLQLGAPVAVGTYIGTMWSLTFDTDEPIEVCKALVAMLRAGSAYERAQVLKYAEIESGWERIAGKQPAPPGHAILGYAHFLCKAVIASAEAVLVGPRKGRMKEVCDVRNKKIRCDVQPWPYKAFEESNKRITEVMWKKTVMDGSSLDSFIKGISQMLAVLNIYAEMDRADGVLYTHLRRIVEGDEMSCVWMREQAGRYACLQHELAIAKATYVKMSPAPQTHAVPATEPDSSSARPEKSQGVRRTAVEKSCDERGTAQRSSPVRSEKGQGDMGTAQPKTASDLEKGLKDPDQAQRRGKQQQQQQQQQEQQQQQQGPKQQVSTVQPHPGEKHKHTCCGCGAEGENFKKCSVCFQRFCSAQCQRDSWKEHKKICKPLST